MKKQITIDELIPLLKKGWVAMDPDGFWIWFSKKPRKHPRFDFWDEGTADFDFLGSAFNIAVVEDWQKSLRKVG